MDIEVGEYVRTDKGIITKAHDGFIERLENGKSAFGKAVKHSYNIIDIIEIGDYVNGRLVLQVDYKNKNICLLIPFTDTLANTNIMWYGYENIETILTHEQYESNCYRLED